MYRVRDQAIYEKSKGMLQGHSKVFQGGVVKVSYCM